MRVKTEAKRESIIEVATKIFQEMGYERASMDAIATRMRGSKVTLYGYFASKQELFLAVAHQMAINQLAPAYDELVSGSDDLHQVLRRFGEKFLAFICSPEAIGAYRMVVAQAGHSDIGRCFFELGPKRGEEALAAFLQSEIDGGRMKNLDPSIAAIHLLALLGAESMQRTVMAVSPSPTSEQITLIVERAITVFMAAYAR